MNPRTVESRRLFSLFTLAAVTGISLGMLLPRPAHAQWIDVDPQRELPATPSYREVIRRVTSMPSDADLQRRVRKYGLNVVNVMWEDTGRSAGSSLGPNISDLSLQVRLQLDRGDTGYLLPVIRYPNFTDKTGDVAARKLMVRVGNHRHRGELRAVPLSRVLRNMRNYLSDPDSLLGDGNFWARRDSHVLVSAQHVFVPLGRNGKARFNPVLFNYQSAPGSPAVMTLLITREGMSATVIENRHDAQGLQGWGQQLYFNNKGQETVFTAERRSAVAARIEAGEATADDAGALEKGADMMMIVQIPLKHRHRGYLPGIGGMGSGAAEMAPASAPKPKKSASRSRGGRSDVEHAVLGHGRDLGPFAEMRGLRLERDERFPVRVTVQFYKATSNGIVSDQDLAEVARSIRKVYSSADYVGSLVVPDGARHRPTDWIKDRGDGWSPWGIVSGAKTAFGW